MMLVILARNTCFRSALQLLFHVIVSLTESGEGWSLLLMVMLIESNHTTAKYQRDEVYYCCTTAFRLSQASLVLVNLPTSIALWLEEKGFFDRPSTNNFDLKYINNNNK